MARMDIALDIGTSYTSIFVSGYGVVLREPSVIVYYCDADGSRKAMRAVGSEAYRMVGKTPERTKLVYPVIDGIIKDPNACADMLTEFIKRILPASYIIKPHVNAVLAVPMGITVDERKMYCDVLMRSGVDEVSMLNSIVLASLGADLPLRKNFAGFVTVIGGGVTELGAIGLGGILTGTAINIGGDMIDSTLIDCMLGLHKLAVDRATVRSVKERICSLYRNDCATMQVSGLDVKTKMLNQVTVCADKLFNAVGIYYKNIIDSVEGVINSCPPGIASEIDKHGVTVLGGGAKITGLERVMSDELKLKVNIPDVPEYATILGGGRVLADNELFEYLLNHA